MAVNLDTGSSDLWVISDTCSINSCEGSTAPRYPTDSMRAAGADVDLFYGDSKTGTFAGGSVALETVCVAGMAMRDQQFLIANDTTNEIVQFETSGIFGLGFPSASRVQEVTTKKRPDDSTDVMIEATDSHGPLIPRMAMTGALQSPMFSITLQRNTIDLSGEGLLTVGKLPDGIDNTSLTWVPVRLYRPEEGGMVPPTYAPDEVYPYRWEIDIEGVFIDGKRLPQSRIPAIDVDSSRTSALLDTGNSLLRGPVDVVNKILGTVSQSFNPRAQYPLATLPCNVPHSLAFQIGGKVFPIDPRDFIGQLRTGDAVTCKADNLVSTDAPSIGTLFRWSLGAPFFRSNLVAFYYGNLTHPSVDPPRIGIRSNVPPNAGELLQQAVQNAVKNGGNFPRMVVAKYPCLLLTSPLDAMLPAPTDSVSNKPIFLDPGDDNVPQTIPPSQTGTAYNISPGRVYTPSSPTSTNSANSGSQPAVTSPYSTSTCILFAATSSFLLFFMGSIA
ncbi:hypothetical protein CVT24_008790 [Panaeolus cyanescens]|uniref:Peptidase A1 domain-containing protein n=1 Tax=Panaeolus cyanescens TaxID=181874 RepID=A0A409VDN8_9AGAR|nr:hypothetical protein CVT24_008790 [Panaeolus cyanescens]